MAIDLEFPRKLRDTAQRIAGSLDWDFEAIFNRELYPAIIQLRRFVIELVGLINIELASIVIRYVPVELTGASNAITEAYEYKHLIVSHGSATSLTMSSVVSDTYQLGAVILISQRGAGQVTIVPTGFTIQTPETLKLRKQWSMAALVKMSSTEWHLDGDLELS